MDMVLLKVRNLTKKFGGVTALDNVTLDLLECSITGLIGPNGSGKTTLFNVINGFYAPDAGTVTFNGKNISDLSVAKITRNWIARTFQEPRLFRELSVLENLLLGFRHERNERLWSAFFQTKLIQQTEAQNAMRVERLLEELKLADKVNEPAGNLSYGQQKLIEFERAEIMSPKLLLLDEPMAGLNPKVIPLMLEKIRKIRDSGKTIFIVTHNWDIVFDLCESVFVMDSGKIIASGVPEKIQDNPNVITAYLGTKAKRYVNFR